MFVIYQIIKANLVPVILAKRETAHSYSQDQTYRWDEFCECLFELCTLCEAQALVKLRSSWRVAQRPSFHEGLLYQAKSVTVSLFNSVMFGFLCSTQFVLFKHRTTQLSFLHQNAYFIVKSFASLKSPDNSSQQQGQEEKHSFRVSYLINSCGLPQTHYTLKTQRNQTQCLIFLERMVSPIPRSPNLSGPAHSYFYGMLRNPFAKNWIFPF